MRKINLFSVLALSTLMAVGSSFTACEKDSNDDVNQEENKSQNGEEKGEESPEEKPQNHEDSPMLGIWEINAYSSEYTGANDKPLKGAENEKLLAGAAEIIGFKINADGTAKVDDAGGQFQHMPSSHSFLWCVEGSKFLLGLKIDKEATTQAQIDAAMAGHAATGSIVMNLTRKGIILNIKDDMLIETVELTKRKQAIEQDKNRIMEKYGFANEAEAKELAKALEAVGRPLDQAIMDAEANGASEEELKRLEDIKNAWMNAEEPTRKKDTNRNTQNEAAQISIHNADIARLDPIINKLGSTIEFIFRKK